MKMRDLEARTGVNRETIRVYFRIGLLPEPHRSARNVADYDESHVKAILAVRALQQRNGLRLGQIREAMRGRAATTSVGAAAFQHLEELVEARVGYQEGKVPLKALTKRNPHAVKDAYALESVKIVSIKDTKNGPSVNLTDARLIEIWGDMREAGFGEDAGFPPEIVAYYVKASEFLAANDATKFLEQTEGRISADKAAAMLQVALPAMLDFFGLLRFKAFMRNLHDATQEGKRIRVPRLPKPPKVGETRTETERAKNRSAVRPRLSSARNRRRTP